MFLLFGFIVPSYPGQDKPEKQEEKPSAPKQEQPAKPEKEQKEAKPAQQAKGQQPQEQKQKQEPAKTSKQQTQHQQQQANGEKEQSQKQQEQAKATEQQTQQVKAQQEPSQKQTTSSKGPQRTQEETAVQHAQPALRLSSRGSGRIPDARFQSNFGRGHEFRMGNPVMVSGYSRFQYGGYWFGYVQPWPVGWYYTDEFYIDYIDGGYYMYNPYYPGARFAITVVI
jgi:hypothetical protein